MGHVTLTTPVLRAICHPHNVTLLILYLYANCDNSSFSCSRDIVGAHQNLNGSHDLTSEHVFHGLVVIHGQALATINLSTKFQVSISTH